MESVFARSELSATHKRFRSVVLPHLPDAHRLARYLTRNRADSQDVVQEAIVRLLRFMDSYRGGDSRAWVLKVVRNTTFTWLSHNRRSDHLPIEEHRSAPPPSAGVAAPHDAELANAPSHESDDLLSLIATLSAAHREVVILRHIRGLSYREISTTLRVPQGTVMSRLSRAHLALARNAREEGMLCLQPVEME